jgi:hypothetical protein
MGADHGPHAYATFLADDWEEDRKARLRMEAVVTVREFLRAMGQTR